MENIFLLSFLFFISTLIFVSTIRKKQAKKTRIPPGPHGLPIIGNLHQLKPPIHKHFSELAKQYGPLLQIKLGSRPVLIASSPKLAEEILKTQDLIFCSRPPLLALRKLGYNGLDIAFGPYGENWREMRKIAVLHLLTAKRVQSFCPIREDEVSRMIQIIASASEAVNLSDIMLFLTSSITCRVAFGKRYGQGSGESAMFNELIHDFQTTISGFYFTDYFPWFSWLDNLTGKLGHLEKVFGEWDSFYQHLIDEHLKPDRPKSMDGDVIDILLKLRSDEEMGPFDVSMDHIKAMVMNAYFASTDTTTTAILWVMTALITNPHVMKKAQNEIKNVKSLSTKKQMVKEEDIKTEELPYLNAVIKESSRMYPTLPLLAPRETMETCTIGGFEIPEKTLVYVNTWALGNDPDVWENPNEFRPERFLVDGKLDGNDICKGSDFDLIPFGGGRRGCPGKSMALATIQLVLANLLYLFDWELPDGLMIEDLDTEGVDGIAMRKKTPLILVAKKVA